MLRQARIMTALAGTDVPVPGIRASDESEPAWFAMDLVPGESLEPVLDDPAVEPALAAARTRRAAEILPALHPVPLDTLPADVDMLSPAVVLARRARTVGVEPPGLAPIADRLESLLAAWILVAIDPVLVHGDHRLGNILSAGTEPAALIDWEVWSPGDPRV